MLWDRNLFPWEKKLKYDLSFYNDRVQTLRQFELDIFDLDCPVASNSELSRFGKGNSLKSRLKQKIRLG